jgi:hypothetical protein
MEVVGKCSFCDMLVNGHKQHALYPRQILESSLQVFQQHNNGAASMLQLDYSRVITAVSDKAMLLA